MEAAAKQQSLKPRGKEAPFHLGQTRELAPGVTLFLGSWNASVIKQDDGLLMIECPLSSSYAAGLLGEAKERNPGSRIVGVLSTSDSWPHVGGIREVVSEDIPVYILDLNRPLLDRFLKAPHTLDPGTRSHDRPRRRTGGLCRKKWRWDAGPIESSCIR
jgi:hypothetical protein